mmetsp:Transcript_13302/g.27277  ORF Transcript_13302/g.27277 Transcript_13302/m.27277 type:complete len:585 (-) Transcript_13302:211-1965(-)|eukprot:CAMPEP_0182457242 /NCGR_PEP_ID=MMETSP1319-20130603/2844_1 /TAXON_ID=172717 /ORGANISM="Bolidomonas pacifica, Strain RCC208" /LENGTH=584 /DNA_ID=CAMNT_0024655663 /DNA_START=137 /DNA_END=1891 /DNA_ORIENTATION=+
MQLSGRSESKDSQEEGGGLDGSSWKEGDEQKEENRNVTPPARDDRSGADPKQPPASPSNPSIVKTGDQEVTVEGSAGPVTRHLNVYDVIGVKFTLPQRYVLLDLIGRGAYGTVCAARDQLTGDQVAIKKISGVFDHVVFSKRCVREIRIMRVLYHENLLGVKNILEGEGGTDFNEIYIVSELMETDLSSVIKSPQSLSNQHLQFFSYQIIRGLSYLHASNIIHRDLKPRNILCNSNCDVSICDFGLARIDFPHMSHKMSSMTDYVATRWYRAPEIIVGWNSYTKAVDVWGIGCILAELVLRKPLFAGSDNEEQLRLICKLLGVPDDETLAKVGKSGNRNFLMGLRQGSASKESTKRRFERYFKEAGATDDCVKVLEGALRFDPDERLTAEELLRCEYFREIIEEEDEDDDDGDGDGDGGPREVGVELPYEDFAFENFPCTAEAMRHEILKEIVWNQTKDKEVLGERGLVDAEAKNWALLAEELPISLGVLKSISEDIQNSEGSPSSAPVQNRARMMSDMSLDEEHLYANADRSGDRRSFSLRDFKEELEQMASGMETTLRRVNLDDEEKMNIEGEKEREEGKRA